MPPTSFCNGAFELMASAGSTFRWPGPASGIRPICTYFDRALSAPRSAPGSRSGTSASVSADALPATALPTIPVDAAARNFLRFQATSLPLRSDIPLSSFSLDGRAAVGCMMPGPGRRWTWTEIAAMERIPMRRPRTPPGHQTWATPPSTNSSVPLMKELLSEARNRTASAISIGRPTRPTGATSLCPFRKPAICSSVMPKLS